jgi:hypothetical protein
MTADFAEEAEYTTPIWLCPQRKTKRIVAGQWCLKNK